MKISETFENIKKNFPMLVANPDLVYLDSASTTQKPKVVLDAISNFYITSNANVHRGMYPLAQEADRLWIEAHQVVGEFIKATPQEVFFTKNATEGINWIAQTLSEQLLKPGDVIVVSDMEHHSNLLPWRRIAKKGDIIIESLRINEEKKVDFTNLEELYEKYGEKIKVVALVHMSNVLGSVNDIKSISKLAHKFRSFVVVDGTQSIAHMSIDVQDLDCDFFIFSGHKLYAPTGIGVVYGKQDLLDQFEPVWQGGEMIDQVTKDRLVFSQLPSKFEAGTPNIEGAIGLANAIIFLNSVNYLEVGKDLPRYLYESMHEIPDIKVISSDSSPILSFNIDGIHPHDIAGELGELNICVRAGYHCAQPLHEKLGIKGSLRVSSGIYNTKADIDKCVDTLMEIVKKYSNE